jgi:hypothetical protein
MKIRGFAHLWMVNDWYVIFSHQMRVLLSSGLYDACEEINIGIILIITYIYQEIESNHKQ